MNKFIKLIFTLALVITTTSFSTINIKASEAFTIDSYNVTINAHENGEISVIETISVNYTYPRHGIHVNIPTNYNMKFDMGGNQVNKNYNFPIKDIKVLSDHEVEIASDRKGVQINLGSPNFLAQTLETYQISYTIKASDLNLNNLQVFYFNLINNWDTTISNYSFDITLPKPFNSESIEFYLGSTSNNLEYVHYEVIDNNIKGSIELPISNNTPFVILIPLEHDYFLYDTINTNSNLIFFFSIIILFLSCLIFKKHAKNKVIALPPDFDQLKDINSSQLGYIMNGYIDNNNITSILINWTNNGYVSMMEDQEILTLTKLIELPESSEAYENILFTSLFANSTSINTNQIRENFEFSMNECKKSLNISIKKKQKKVFYLQSKNYLLSTFIITIISSLLFINFNLYSYFYSYKEGVLATVTSLFSLTCLFYCLFILNTKKHSLSTYTKISLYLIIILMYAINLLTLLICGQYGNTNIIYSIVVSISTLLIAIVSQKMIKRTSYGINTFSIIMELRQFILYTDNEAIKELLVEQPSLFNTILPYAYSMDLSDIWIDKFKDLQILESENYLSTLETISTNDLYKNIDIALLKTEKAMASISPLNKK